MLRNTPLEWPRNFDILFTPFELLSGQLAALQPECVLRDTGEDSLPLYYKVSCAMSDDVRLAGSCQR